MKLHKPYTAFFHFCSFFFEKVLVLILWKWLIWFYYFVSISWHWHYLISKMWQTYWLDNARKSGKLHLLNMLVHPCIVVVTTSNQWTNSLALLGTLLFLSCHCRCICKFQCKRNIIEDIWNNQVKSKIYWFGSIFGSILPRAVNKCIVSRNSPRLHQCQLLHAYNTSLDNQF